MGLFNKKSDQEEIEDIYKSFGLGSAEEIRNANKQNLKDIRQDMLSVGTKKIGFWVGVGSSAEKVMIGFLSAIYHSNMILIRQNELIIQALTKEKKEAE